MKIEFEDKNGIDLYKWLTENDEKIKKQRLLYIISTKAEPEIIKIGISNKSGRIWSYVNTHGITNKKNKCEGVNLYFIASTEYNPNTSDGNSEVANIEKKVKNYMKRTNRLINQIYKNKYIRGDERFEIKPVAFIKIVKQFLNKEREYKEPINSFIIKGKEYKLREEYKIKWNDHNDIKYKGWIKARITRIYQNGGVMFRVTDEKAKRISSKYHGNTYNLYNSEKYFEPNQLISNNIKP